MEVNKSTEDGRIRSAVILTPAGNLISRPVNHLVPLEIPQSDETMTPATPTTEPVAVNVDSASDTNRRPRRAAATRAEDGISHPCCEL